MEHVHYLATSFKEKGTACSVVSEWKLQGTLNHGRVEGRWVWPGFQKRQGNEGHDIPVLVSGKLRTCLLGG